MLIACDVIQTRILNGRENYKMINIFQYLCVHLPYLVHMIEDSRKSSDQIYVNNNYNKRIREQVRNIENDQTQQQELTLAAQSPTLRNCFGKNGFLCKIR